jgi:hypothetical protein
VNIENDLLSPLSDKPADRIAQGAAGKRGQLPAEIYDGDFACAANDGRKIHSSSAVRDEALYLSQVLCEYKNCKFWTSKKRNADDRPRGKSITV